MKFSADLTRPFSVTNERARENHSVRKPPSIFPCPSTDNVTDVGRDYNKMTSAERVVEK